MNPKMNPRQLNFPMSVQDITLTISDGEASVLKL